MVGSGMSASPSGGGLGCDHRQPAYTNTRSALSRFSEGGNLTVYLALAGDLSSQHSLDCH